MTHEPPLDAARLEAFERLLHERPGARRRAPEVWRAFAAAFPHRPQGPSERRLLLRALEELEGRGRLRLPSRAGRLWDRGLQPPLPAAVELVRARRPAADRVWKRFPWHPALHWVADEPRLTPDQMRFLERVHRGLVEGDFRDPAPMKYRSLQLTGHEKRLAGLARGDLFGAGRLSLDLLGCLPDVVPLAWEAVGDGQALLVFENAGPFAVACHVLRAMACPPYGTVGYGAGKGFISAVGYLPSLKRPIARIDYVGDLDAAGLAIAARARARAEELGLAPLRPATELHAAMLAAAAAFGAESGWPADDAKRSAPRRDVLVRALDASLAGRVRAIVERGNRIPEEVLGPREMRAALEAVAARGASA